MHGIVVANLLSVSLSVASSGWLQDPSYSLGGSRQSSKNIHEDFNTLDVWKAFAFFSRKKQLLQPVHSFSALSAPVQLIRSTRNRIQYRPFIRTGSSVG